MRRWNLRPIAFSLNHRAPVGVPAVGAAFLAVVAYNPGNQVLETVNDFGNFPAIPAVDFPKVRIALATAFR
jgi:hypothetical protein